MLKISGTILGLASLYLAYVIYLAYWQPMPPIPEEALRLATHFAKDGIEVTPSSIRFGSTKAGAVISYNFEDVQQSAMPILVHVYSTRRVAESEFDTLKESPNFFFVIRNENMIMSLVQWEESDLSEQVLISFKAFNP